VASALLDRGRLDEAIVEYERVLVQTPHAALSRYGLARAYQRKGDVPSARKHFERFLHDWRDADPDIPEIVAAKQWLAGQNIWR
jgi:tetratricopeptide (TPR) repeat protein